MQVEETAIICRCWTSSAIQDASSAAETASSASICQKGEWLTANRVEHCQKAEADNLSAFSPNADEPPCMAYQACRQSHRGTTVFRFH